MLEGLERAKAAPQIPLDHLSGSIGRVLRLVNRFLRREGASLRLRGERGERNQAIGRSHGGRATKIHVLTDKDCRPIAFLLTGGQVADCVAADLVHRDMGCDTNAVRQKI